MHAICNAYIQYSCAIIKRLYKARKKIKTLFDSFFNSEQEYKKKFFFILAQQKKKS